MPALSSTMTEGKIVEWLKKPGEKVARGESVLVVESDKADMDVESFQEGYLAAVLMPAGSTAPVGETIGLIVENEEEIAAVKAKAPESSDQNNPVKEEKGADQVVNTESAKNTSSDSIEAEVTAEVEKKEFILPDPLPTNNGRVVATPRAKKLSTQLGVDLSRLRGSGPHGRIQAEDVLRAKGQPITVPWIAESNAPAASLSSVDPGSSKSNENLPRTEKPLTGNSFGAPGESVPFNTLQQAVNRNMEQSLSVPCFRVGYKITTDKFDAFYKEVKPKGVTMTALLVKAVGVALSRHPQVNASYGSNGMVYPLSVNVAVAVAMEDGGLITPVLQNADTQNLYTLSSQWSDLVKRSRSKQLQPNEYNSGTFTLSNLGMFGVDRFDAILPPGTGAILAVAASQPCVVAKKDGSIAIKSQMQVNLTADHRVIYGADGAAFLKDLASLIEENPETLGS